MSRVRSRSARRLRASGGRFWSWGVSLSWRRGLPRPGGRSFCSMSLSPPTVRPCSTGGGGADIGPMMERGMPGMALNVESTEYFWYHHTDADTLDKLDPEEVARCVAAMAVMAYVVADWPEPLPR